MVVTPDEPASDQPPDDDAARTTVMLLGSDEFSRELAIVFQRLGTEVIAVERHADAPAHKVADQSVVIDMTDTDELAALIGRLQPNYVVTVSDAVAADALTAAAETGFAQVFPTARSARLTADREGLRRLAAEQLGLPTAPFWFAGSLDELSAVAEHAGYPLRIQPVAGPGGSVASNPHELEGAWQRAVSACGPHARARVLAEAVVEVDFHVTLLTVRSDGPTGPGIEFCSPIGHSRATNDAVECWQPQEMSRVALDAAKSIAARIVKAVGGRGLFGVELMVRGDEVYFCGVSARPYEHALLTLRTQRLSAFELQARSVLGLGTDTIMISPGAAQVLYSSRRTRDDAADNTGPIGGVLGEALAVPESDVRVFGSDSAAEGQRRLGVAVVTAADVPTARDRARQVAAALRKLWKP
ncbi:phosphoribosylglycinamide formyltransferase [Mycobacterium shimoidei]|nr:phosphoribosylglycinamide formyltransferase 2 [Mycobacterium shimoidei]ORW81564.1 phosphoribosylglycinamide formyltransferase [Mycobacterium shimoidei]